MGAILTKDFGRGGRGVDERASGVDHVYNLLSSVIDDLDNIKGVVNKLRADETSLLAEVVKARKDIAAAGVNHIHADADVGKVTTADATDLASALVLVNDLAAKYGTTHIGSTGAHKAADTTNVLTSTIPATNQTEGDTLATEIKADYNAHRSQAGVHYNDDSGNAVTAADGNGTEGVLVTLVNDCKTQLNAHAAAAMTSSDVTQTATADAAVGTTKE